MPQSPLDPQAVALAKAIRQTESGGNFTVKGKSGEYGAYQFMPDTWKAYSKEAGVNANLDQATPEQQNQVAYTKIKQWKDQGYNPGQIASMWNAGPGRPDAYLTGHKGTNDKGVAFDTQSYATRVAQYYQQFKPQGGVGQDVAAPQIGGQKQNPTLLDDLSKTAVDAGTGFSSALTRTLSGQINPLSGLIQGGGAIAGGVGSALTNVLEHTPLVGTAFKGLESLIGSGVGALAQTQAGQGLVNNYQQFAQEHPELAGDIAGALNIASVVPIGKGLSLLKGGLTDAAETAVKGSATKGAEKEIAASLTARGTKGLVSAEKRGLNPVKTLVSNKTYLPDVVRSGDKFVYDSTKAAAALNKSLDVDETALQEMLKTAVKKNIGVDLETVRARVLKDVTKEYAMSGNYRAAKNAVNDYFDSFLESTGGRKVIDLNELNGLKRDVRKSVFNIAGDVKGTATADVKYNIGQSVMKQVEEIAKQAGAKDVPALNKLMGEKIEALKILESLNGKAVKGGAGGTGREIAKDVAGGVGEMAGNTIGIPLAGTFAGRGLAGLVGRRVPRTAIGKLKSSRPLKATIRKGTGQVTKGLVGQGAAQQLQPQQ